MRRCYKLSHQQQQVAKFNTVTMLLILLLLRYLFSGSLSSPLMNMLAVGVEGDIGAEEELSGAADITFSVSIEAEAISVLLLVLVLTVLLISDTVLAIPVLTKTTFIFISTQQIKDEPVNFSAIKNNQ